MLLAAFLVGVIGGFIWALTPRYAGWLGPFSGATLVLAATLFLAYLKGAILDPSTIVPGRFCWRFRLFRADNDNKARTRLLKHRSSSDSLRHGSGS
jgi:hypothetical protein